MPKRRTEIQKAAELYLQGDTRPDRAKARELARIDLLEREAWSGWFESKKEPPITPAKTDKGGASKSIGNADYLATVQWCIETRCKIRGFFAPVKPDPNRAVKDEAGRMVAGDVVSKLKM
jgi:hypothetical protein